MTALVPFDEVASLDAELIRLGRGMASVRLRAGEALEALASRSGHHELGFSSLDAYARERCQRSGRWAADTRALARRLLQLPLIRSALQRGEISWSMAELVARIAAPHDEREWLGRARHSTVRAMRELVHHEKGVDRGHD